MSDAEDVIYGIGCIVALGIGIAVAAFIWLSGGDSDDESGGSADPPAAAGKFEQTWNKDYGDTNCDDWNNEMTDKQKFVASADMLTTARRADGGEGLPRDSLIREFQGGMTTACVEPSQIITGVSSLLYITERARFSP
jgi:hypothetical protein